MQKDINFKIIVLGAQGVGKSSLINRYIKGQFNDQYNVTVGVEFASKIVHLNSSTTVRLQIWDTAGQQLYQSIVRSFYKGIAAVFLLYSVDQADSLTALDSWVRQAKQHAHEQTVFFLIGSRADISDRQITKQQANKYLQNLGGAFAIETSAKNGSNITALFDKACEILYQKYQQCPSFRNLVKPVVAESIAITTTSVLNVKGSFHQKTKKCC